MIKIKTRGPGFYLKTSWYYYNKHIVRPEIFITFSLFIYNTYNQPFNLAWKNYGI